MAKRGHKPQRTCLGCGTRDVQGRMVRLAMTGEDQLQVEPQRGRGGYLHRDAKCQKAFVTRKGHYRAFHVEVNRTAKAKLIDSLTAQDWE